MKELTLDVASESPGAQRDEYWKAHYRAVFAQPNPWLDYSNHRVHLQSLAVALEAAGGVLGRACLDAGCGRGQLSIALQGLGAAAVTGFDVNAVAIDELRAKHPSCEWLAGSISDPATYANLGRFDLVFALEVLQYVTLDGCLPLLWNATGPGGRLIALVPNRECPIVGKSMQRFSGQYGAISPSELQAAVSGLEDLQFWACRGLWFRDDQSIAPYDLSPWTEDAGWERPPNRLLFIAQRAPEARP